MGFPWFQRPDPPRIARILLAVLASLVARSDVRGQASDLIDAADLGPRGVVFESPLIEKSSSLEGGVGVGDVNGDQLADILLAVQEAPADTPNPFLVVLVLGREGLVGRHTVPGDLPGTVRFRPSVQLRYSSAVTPGPAGDVDRDGLADFYFSFPLYPGPANEYAGAGFLVHGSRDLEGEHATDEVGGAVRGVVFTSSDPAHDGIGRSFASPGDVNGDGEMDLVIGAPFSANAAGQVNAGVVFVLFEPAGLPAVVDLAGVGTSIAGIQIHGNPKILDPGTAAQVGYETIGFLGLEIRPAGDFDGDGLADLLMREDEAEGVPLYLFRGRAVLPPVIDIADLASLENISAIRMHLDGFLPGGFAGAGDLDGDGRSEIAAGAPRHSLRPGVVGSSSAFLIRGGTDLPGEVEFAEGPALDVAFSTFRALGSVDRFGAMVSPAGDLNGDRIPDLVVGATGAQAHGKRNAGEAYVIFGKPDPGEEVFLREGFDGIRILGENTGNRLGWGASPAGDFNGDGADDLLLLTHQGLVEDSTRAYVIYGTGSGPPPLRLYRAEPAFGPLRGGTTVKLKGSGFTGIAGNAGVLFNGRPGPNVIVLSGSEIQVDTPPAGAAGVVDVTLILGVETRTIAGGFEYTPDFPQIDFGDFEERGLILDGEAGTWPGYSLALGDLTGDGVADLAAGSSTPGGWVVTVVRGGPGLPPRLPTFAPSARSSIITSIAPAEHSSASVAALGDVNADGAGDLGIGLAEGVAYILFGRASFAEEIVIEEELFERRAVRLEASGAASDVVLARLGDVTEDRIGDFAVALSRASASAIEAGEIIVVAGRTAWPEDFDLDATALTYARIQGSRDGERFGEEIASAGDVNGDGWQDLLAAEPGGGGAGRAYLLLGGPQLPAEIDVESYVLDGGAVRIDIEDGFEHFSWLHVAAAGDTNGDGFDDFQLGVEDGGESNHGVAYLVRGGPSLPQTMSLQEEPATPDGVARFFGASPMVQAGRIGPAGDFNADGRDDCLIAQQPDLSTAGAPGRLFVMLGVEDETPASVDLASVGGRGLEIAGPGAGQIFLPCRESGDLNGDGQLDFAFQGWSSIFGPDILGSVYVVFGPFGGTTFRRADANFDGRIEISDAIFTLAYLFLGGEAPQCHDSVDADDDGVLRLTDAVYTLNHLFLGGPKPPLPYPEEGNDPTEDALQCRGF